MLVRCGILLVGSFSAFLILSTLARASAVAVWNRQESRNSSYPGLMALADLRSLRYFDALSPILSLSG
jgi:hypothetical protein